MEEEKEIEEELDDEEQEADEVTEEIEQVEEDQTEENDIEEFYGTKKVPNNDGKKKLTIIFIVVGSIIVLLLFILILSTVLGKKDNGGNEQSDNGGSNNNNPEQKEEIDPDLVEDTRERIPRTNPKMMVYLYKGEYVEDSYCNDECKNSASGYVGIDVAELDARIVDITPHKEYKGDLPNYILYKDGSKLKYFSLSEFYSHHTNLSTEYVKYVMYEYNNNLEAIYFKKKGENGLYSVATKKSYYINKYDKFEALSTGLIKGIKGDKKDILSINEEKVLDNVDLDLLQKMQKVANFNVVKETSGEDELYTIYDNNFNKIANKINKNLTYFEGNTVYFIQEDKILGYTNDGNKQYESKTKHDAILMVLKDYYVSMNNNNFELRMLKDDKFVMTDNILGYKIDYYHSGVKDKSELTSLTGQGIYLAFLKESGGSLTILEEYYDPATGNTKTDTVTK